LPNTITEGANAKVRGGLRCKQGKGTLRVLGSAGGKKPEGVKKERSGGKNGKLQYLPGQGRGLCLNSVIREKKNGSYGLVSKGSIPQYNMT